MGFTKSMVGTHIKMTNRRTLIMIVCPWIRSLSLSLGSACSPKPRTITIIVDIIEGAESFYCTGSSIGASKSVSHLTMMSRSMKPKSASNISIWGMNSK